MATQVLHSFAELAAVLGNEVKARKVESLQTFMAVKTACGRKAAIIWAFLNDQESCKRYGNKGEHIHDVPQLALVTSYDQADVSEACVRLVMQGYARLAANGQQIKPA